MFFCRRASFFFSPLMVCAILTALPDSSAGYQQLSPHGTGTLNNDRVSQNTRMPNATAPGARGAKETYAVVAVGDDVRVVTQSSIASLKKQNEDDYKQDTKKYQEAKKDKNNPVANKLKKPDKKDYTVKSLKSNIKSKEEADKFADEIIKERGKSGGKKTSTGNNNW